MTSPVEEVTVRCPGCGHVYRDWFRASVNLALDDFDDDYLRQCSTATCPRCATVTGFDSVVVADDAETWLFG